MEMFSNLFSGEFKAENGSLCGICHKQPNPERVEVVTQAYSKTAYANPLNPDAFPGIRKMEAEVVRMTCNLFHGDPNESCGTVKYEFDYELQLKVTNQLNFDFR